MDAELNATKMLSTLLFLYMVFNVCCGLVCGPNLVSYDPATHVCNKNNVILKTQVPERIRNFSDKIHPTSHVQSRRRHFTNRDHRFTMCLVEQVGGKKLEYIDTHFWWCDHGRLVKKFEPTTVRPPTTKKPTTDAKHPSSQSSNIAWSSASSACRSGLKSLLPPGFDCCLDLPYRPEDQTCCTQSGMREVFNGSERHHVCCVDHHVFSVYLRGDRHLPCQHASTNDQFFGKKRYLNPAKLDDTDLSHMCQDSYLVFSITVEKQTKPELQLFAKLTGWRATIQGKKVSLTQLSSPYENEPIEIELDEQIQVKKRLQRKPFFVLTNYNYFNQAVFFLKPEDKLYKFPKNKKHLGKILRRLNKRCKQYSRKSKSGS